MLRIICVPVVLLMLFSSGLLGGTQTESTTDHKTKSSKLKSSMDGATTWSRGPYKISPHFLVVNYQYLGKVSIRWKYEEVDNSPWKALFEKAWSEGNNKVKVDYTPIYGLKEDGKPNYKNIKGYRIENATFSKLNLPAKKK